MHHELLVGPSTRKYNSARFTHIYWSLFVIKTMICNIFSWVELRCFFHPMNVKDSLKISWKTKENLLKQWSCKTVRHCFNYKWILLRFFVDVPVVCFCECCLNSYCVIQRNFFQRCTTIWINIQKTRVFLFKKIPT